MSREPISVTVALDPGTAVWSLRRLLQRTAIALGTPPLDPVLAVTRPFLLEGGRGLAAVRAAVEPRVPGLRWLAYDLDGFTAGERTIGLHLKPSEPLAAAAAAIESALLAVAAPARLPDERFLVPVARGLDRRACRSAMRTLGISRLPWYRRLLPPSGSAVASPPPVSPPLRLLESHRLLVLVGDRPVGGYDLPTGRWLSPIDLSDRATRTASLRAYRRARGIEIVSPAHHAPGETWLLADLHLGHPGIVAHAARPFPASDVGEMDRVLVGNWRSTVAPGDRALLLGDLCAGTDPDAYRAAVAGLTGRITLVRGNHDPDLPGLLSSVAFEDGDHRFFGVHDPADAPPDFEGWVVHGHLHETDLRRFPFFDPVARRVNVSVETAGYSPVPLSLVTALISSRAGRIPVRKIRPPVPPNETSQISSQYISS